MQKTNTNKTHDSVPLRGTLSIDLWIIAVTILDFEGIRLIVHDVHNVQCVLYSTVKIYRDDFLAEAAWSEEFNFFFSKILEKSVDHGKGQWNILKLLYHKITCIHLDWF